MMNTTPQVIDFTALKFNQASIITLTLLAFILDIPTLAGVVAVILIAGSLKPKLALFIQVYVAVLKPLNLLKPNPVEDFPAPHEFAQLLGGIVLGAGSVLLFAGSILSGWLLAWIVIILAAANLFLGFCAGCFVYYQLGKLGVPGFHSSSHE